MAGNGLPYTDATHQPFIRCRTLGHAWHDYDSNHWKASFGVGLTVRCERCGMERRDTVASVTGELVTRHYVRPPGYQYTKDAPAPTRSQFRLMLLGIRNKERRKK